MNEILSITGNDNDNTIKYKEQLIKVYHGSNTIVTQPSLADAKNTNDYGRGFYVTTDLKQAKEWAALMGENSYYNEYVLDISDLNICDLNSFGILHWIAEILKHRGLGSAGYDKAISIFCNHYRIDTTKYDIIHGYRADNSYFLIIKSFLENKFTLDELTDYLNKHKPSRQICLCTDKALSKLEFQRASKVSKSDRRNAIKQDKEIRQNIKSAIISRNYNLTIGYIDISDKETFTNHLKQLV